MKIYYGNETKKALQNFQITNQPVNIEFIHNLLLIKEAALEVNYKLNYLEEEVYKGIHSAIKMLKTGEFDDQFVTDSIQGGAGTSINMNVNEVIATLANELTKGEKVIHPLDHVNRSQSTNDVIPTAFKLSLLKIIDQYIDELNGLEKSFKSKSMEFSNVLKVGRTHLQDAVPITLGQEFNAHASLVSRDIKRLEYAKKTLLETNLGGTAIGTGINSSNEFIKEVNSQLSVLTGYNFIPADNLIDVTQNTDMFLYIASLFKTSVYGLSKVANDLRLMASGPRAGFGEINLPELQKGSTIMPGKTNPVGLELINQVGFFVAGSEEVASQVVISGQLELNVMLPVLIKTSMESYTALISAVKIFREKVIDVITANDDHCLKVYRRSLASITLLNNYIGYDKVEEIVRNAIENDIDLFEAVRSSGLLSQEQIENLANPKHLTTPAR